jgi:hypothetical protein
VRRAMSRLDVADRCESGLPSKDHSMKNRIILLGGVLLLAGASVFAHHVQAGLSSMLGAETLTEVLYVAKSGKIGVAPHAIGTEDPFVEVVPHATLTVTDTDGNSETAVVTSGLFSNPAQVDLQEAAQALGAQLSLAEMLVVNDTLVIRGKDGGSASSLSLTDSGGLLGSLGIATGTTVLGADDIELSISVSPEGHHHHHHHHDPAVSLAHHPYVMILSATEGVTGVGGVPIPVAFDATTDLGLRALNMGLLPGFVGELDEFEDATATFDTALLAKFFPAGLPERLFFTFVVFNEDVTGISYVSNRFDVLIDE